jgi:tetratricopeptide (TPR) repeat protein
VYLKRATDLCPTDPELWYLRGAAEQAAGNETAAWDFWRHSLQLSDRYLADVLKRLGDRPDPEAVMERLLPEQPEMLVEAADWLYPKDKEATELLLKRALDLLQRRTMLPPDLWLRGRIQERLGLLKEAADSYFLALERDPGQTQWRYERADLLMRLDRPKEAEPELERVLREQPHHADAKALLESLRRTAH